MNRPKSDERAFGLDLLRATAIALVLLSHVLLVPLCVFSRRHPAWSVMAGHFGVELFFVLSGFLIGGILIRDFSQSTTEETLARFWCRRWLRTLPLFYLFLAINVAIDSSHGGPATGWWWNAVFLQNFTRPAGPFFKEAWSLAVEEWFYLLAPALIFASLKIGLPLKRAVLWVALGGIVGATAWRMHMAASGHLNWYSVRPVVTMRLDACMFGVLAAWWNHYAPESWNAWRGGKLGIGILCLVGVGAMFELLPLDSSFAASTHLFTLTSVGAMLCLPALAALRTPRAKMAQAVTFTSKWSYAMYLVNFPIFLWLGREAGRALEEPLTAAVAAVSTLMFTVCASAALHSLYETPILRWRDRRVGGASAKIGASPKRRWAEPLASQSEAFGPSSTAPAFSHAALSAEVTATERSPRL